MWCKQAGPATLLWLVGSANKKSKRPGFGSVKGKRQERSFNRVHGPAQSFWALSIDMSHLPHDIKICFERYQSDHMR
jgi:hypothetical protein